MFHHHMPHLDIVLMVFRTLNFARFISFYFSYVIHFLVRFCIILLVSAFFVAFRGVIHIYLD